MIRRELFSYTVFFCMGIIVSFTFLEKEEYFWAALISFVIFEGIDRLAGEGTFDSLYIKRFLFSFILGFLIFLMQFILVSDYRLYNENKAPHEEFASMKIEGKIKAVRKVKEGLSFDIDCGDSFFYERIRVTYYGDKQDGLLELSDLYGKKISCQGKLRIPDERENPMTFDYRLYLKSIGIKYVFSANHIEILEAKMNVFERCYFFYKNSLMKKRALFEASFENDEKVQGVIKGILWGDKADIEEEIKKEFNLNGTGHILAVSGLHIGFIFSLLKFFSRRRNTLITYLLMVIIVLAYGEMTMFSPSTVRAIIVMTVSLFSMHLKRAFDLLSSISLATIIILIVNPYQLFNTGFHMTMLAMIGIAFLAKPLTYFVGDNLSMPLAVTLAISPYTAYVFNRFNPITILINIPIIFLGSLVVPLCFVSLCIISVFGVSVEIINNMILVMCKILLKMNEVLFFDGKFSQLSHGYNIGYLISFYGLLFVLASEWGIVKFIRKEYHLIRRALIFVLAISMTFGATYRNKFADDDIIFVSVGQGDCTHIREGKNDIFIDGGGNPNTNVGEKILLPYILKNGSTDLDLALVTHLHMDHYKGLEELSEVFNIKKIGFPIQYKNAILDDRQNLIDKNAWQHAEINYVSAKNKIVIGDNSYIEPLWPARSAIENVSISESENENNMAYMINYDKIKILVLGDMTGEDEKSMVDYYKGSDKLSCDVLRISHHGSSSSTTDELLDATQPKASVISVGKRNFYGHPSDRVLTKLKDRGIKIYRTDIQGAVGLEIRNGKIQKIDTIKKSN